MLAPIEILARLKERLVTALEGLHLTQDAGLLSVILELPQAPTFAPPLAGPRFQFAHRDRNRLQAGYGIAAEWRASGAGRLRQLRAQAVQLRASWQQLDVDETGQRGFALLGFAASPTEAGGHGDGTLPDALLWIPELAIVSERGRGALVLSTPLPADPEGLRSRWAAWLERLLPLLASEQPDTTSVATRLRRSLDRPDIAEWEALVYAALTEIDQGRLDKVVISRRLRVATPRAFDLQRLMIVLGELFPSCQLIELSRGQTSFVAATPERLLAQHGDQVEVDAIAGTVARAASLDRDVELSEALTNSAKDRREHDLVIQAVRTALASCSREVAVPPHPSVMQLRNAQHLWSPVRARLDPGMDVLTLAELLHPTPATNGEPRRAASAWLRRSEAVDRGWYTGAAGIITPDLTGELWVLLRCAEINGATADLFAGAGIVAGSDPLCEWQETEDKLAAMLTALELA